MKKANENQYKPPTEKELWVIRQQKQAESSKKGGYKNNIFGDDTDPEYWAHAQGFDAGWEACFNSLYLPLLKKAQKAGLCEDSI